MLNIKRESGFTLAEIVAVIVILGLLSGVITPQIVKTIRKGRDVRRIADIDSLASALQAYYLDNAAYPTAAAWTDSTGTFLEDLSSGNYITQTIEDPKNDDIYRYAYKRDTSGDIPFAVIGCTQFEELDSMGGSISGKPLYYYKQLYER
jgi:general secretion pathway protein G